MLVRSVCLRGSVSVCFAGSGDEGGEGSWTHQVDMSFGSMPSRVQRVDCSSSACSLVKQLLSFKYPFSRKKSICSCESAYCCSAASAIVIVKSVQSLFTTY